MVKKKSSEETAGGLISLEKIVEEVIFKGFLSVKDVTLSIDNYKDENGQVYEDWPYLFARDIEREREKLDVDVNPAYKINPVYGQMFILIILNLYQDVMVYVI